MAQPIQSLKATRKFQLCSTLLYNISFSPNKQGPQQGLTKLKASLPESINVICLESTASQCPLRHTPPPLATPEPIAPLSTGVSSTDVAAIEHCPYTNFISLTPQQWY